MTVLFTINTVVGIVATGVCSSAAQGDVNSATCRWNGARNSAGALVSRHGARCGSTIFSVLEL